MMMTQWPLLLWSEWKRCIHAVTFILGTIGGQVRFIGGAGWWTGWWTIKGFWRGGRWISVHPRFTPWLFPFFGLPFIWLIKQCIGARCFSLPWKSSKVAFCTFQLNSRCIQSFICLFSFYKVDQLRNIYLLLVVIPDSCSLVDASRIICTAVVRGAEKPWEMETMDRIRDKSCIRDAAVKDRLITDIFLVHEI